MGKPKIRFKGYTDEWEQRKLNTITDVRDGTHDSPKYVEVGHPFITSKNVKDGYINYDDVQYVSDEDFEEINKRSKVDINDILMGMIGTVGNIALVRETPNFAIKNVALIKDTEEVFYLYLYHCLQSNSIVSQLSENLDGGTQKFIALNKIRNLNIPLPNKNEQYRVGNFLEILDNLITLHQRKYEQAKTLKKYMLQKMFPQDGMRVPEIRFAGFTDEWEQRKLGDIFKEYSEKGHPELPALTIIQGGGTIRRDTSDRNLQYDEASLANYKMVNEGDFIVHLRSFEGGFEKATIPGIISPAYHTFHGEDTDSRFYYSYFRSPKFIGQDLKPHVYGIRDGRSIDIEGMKTIEIPWTSIKEQRAIGDYIDCLDHLITLHQRKCDELRKIKKYMLQNMFC